MTGLACGQASRRDQEPHRDERSGDQRHEPGRARRDHGQHDRAGDPRARVPRRRAALDFAHEREARVVPVPPEETGVCLEQERVARFEHDVADLRADALALAVHRDDGRVVVGAETNVTHRLTDQR